MIAWDVAKHKQLRLKWSLKLLEEGRAKFSQIALSRPLNEGMAHRYNAVPTNEYVTTIASLTAVQMSNNNNTLNLWYLRCNIYNKFYKIIVNKHFLLYEDWGV